MTVPDNRIRFQPGKVVASIGATQIVDNHVMLELLRRHLAGDWGDVCCEDAQANERAVKHGDRILSSYEVDGPEGKEKLWVLTEANRSQTTVLTPGEY